MLKIYFFSDFNTKSAADNSAAPLIITKIRRVNLNEI